MQQCLENLMKIAEEFDWEISEKLAFIVRTIFHCGLKNLLRCMFGCSDMKVDYADLSLTTHASAAAAATAAASLAAGKFKL